MKDLKWSFSSHRVNGKRSLTSHVDGSLCIGDELYAIGSVVVHQKSKEFIESRWRQVMDPVYLTTGIVELVFLRAIQIQMPVS